MGKKAETFELTFVFPNGDEPGYLKRRRELHDVMMDDFTPDGIERLIEFLLRHVREPADKTVAREAIENMSRAEIGALLLRFMQPPELDPNSQRASAAGSED